MSDNRSGGEPETDSLVSRAARSMGRVRRLIGARGRLQADNDRLRGELAALRVEQQGPRDLGYLFVVTYGRSGSTLLMGLLNQIPGYVIRGENRAALRQLHNYHRTLMRERERHSATRSGQSTHPWFGIADVPPQRLTDGVRHLAVSTLLRPGPGTRVTGFKEIRWAQGNLEEHVAWLQEVFPGARFVINTRGLENVLQSRWWAEGDQEKNERVLRSADQQVRALATSLGDAAHHVHFDDYIADPTALRGLYAWLGEEWDEAGVRATLAVPHSIPTRRHEAPRD